MKDVGAKDTDVSLAEAQEWARAKRKEIRDSTVTLTPENVKMLFGFDIEGDTDCLIMDGKIVTPWCDLVKGAGPYGRKLDVR